MPREYDNKDDMDVDAAREHENTYGDDRPEERASRRPSVYCGVNPKFEHDARWVRLDLTYPDTGPVTSVSASFYLQMFTGDVTAWEGNEPDMQYFPNTHTIVDHHDTGVSSRVLAAIEHFRETGETELTLT